jgi:hypothetical protein
MKNVRHRVPTRNVCPSNKLYPSARCAYAAKVVGKDLNIFAIGAISLNHIYNNLSKILIILVHNPNVLCYVILSSYIPLFIFVYFCLFFCINLFSSYLTVICRCLYAVFVLHVTTSIYTVLCL